MTTGILWRVDPTRLRSLAVTAALVGVAAGLVAATVALVAGEPAVDDAISLEAAASAELEAATEAAAAGEGGEEATVSRADQRGIGLFGGYALVGAACGAVLAVAVHGLRVGRPDVARRVRTAGLVLAGAFTVAPWLTYPPNPPAVGDPATLTERQWLYVGVICIALVVGLAAAELALRLARRGVPDHLRLPAVALAVAVPMTLAFVLLPPAPDEVAVPASLVWRFRLASLGANLTMWAVLTFGLSAVAGEAAGAEAGGAGAASPAPSPA